MCDAWRASGKKMERGRSGCCCNSGNVHEFHKDGWSGVEDRDADERLGRGRNVGEDMGTD